MHILIAPNAFKNSLTAPAAAAAILSGLHQSRLRLTAECFPIGDGGDGTGELILQRLNGQNISCPVHDPLGRPITGSFGLIDGGHTAVIEMADASGIRLLRPEELSPLKANTFGTGETIRQALDGGARNIILCVGGSATTDGGSGILSALGIRFLDKAGSELPAIPEYLEDLDRLDTSGLDQRIGQSHVTILCDVENKLLGPQGAAAVFGPQKGATPLLVEKLEAGLRQLSAVAFRETGRRMDMLRHGGAAGGVAAGLSVGIGAELAGGIDRYLELTGFDAVLEKANLLITGEGSIDEQTLDGKGPYGVASRAKQKGIPVIGLAGKVPLAPGARLQEYFDVLLTIGNGPSGLPEAMSQTEENLSRVSRQIGNLLSSRYLI